MTREERLLGLMQRHQADVWRHLRMLGCDAALADDLTQDVFLRALDRPFEGLGHAADAAYLRKAARHHFLNWLKRERRVLPLDIEAAEAAWVEATGDDSEERIAALRRCLDTLEPRPRQALELRYRDGLAEAAVAQAMNTSLDAAKALLKRTREKLRECVQRQVKP